MKWKFWASKKNQAVSEELQRALLPMSTLFRWYCYDVDHQNPNEIGSFFGLSPISDEVEEMEKKDSDERVMKIAYILPLLKAVADINGTVLARDKAFNAVSELEIDNDKKQQVLQIMAENLSMVSISALIPAFAAAFSLGFIKQGDVAAQVIEAYREQF